MLLLLLVLVSLCFSHLFLGGHDTDDATSNTKKEANDKNADTESNKTDKGLEEAVALTNGTYVTQYSTDLW